MMLVYLQFAEEMPHSD